MEWFKKHIDTVIVLTGILSSLVWMNGKFNEIDKRLVRIETVLIMKDLMPKELAIKNEKQS